MVPIKPSAKILFGKIRINDTLKFENIESINQLNMPEHYGEILASDRALEISGHNKQLILAAQLGYRLPPQHHLFEQETT